MRTIVPREGTHVDAKSPCYRPRVIGDGNMNYLDNTNLVRLFLTHTFWNGAACRSRSFILRRLRHPAVSAFWNANVRWCEQGLAPLTLGVVA